MNNGSHQRFRTNRLNNIKKEPSYNDRAIFYGIVKDICLNETSTLFKKNGGYNSIGLIIFDSLTKDIGGVVENLRAKPLYSNNIHYPVIGETIMILRGPGVNGADADTPSSSFYYLPPVGLFSNPTYNPLSTTSFLNYNRPAPNKQREKIAPGLVPNNFESKTTTGLIPTPINSDAFIDSGNVRPTRVFIGDIIYQGRYGHSIRFSSNKPKESNSWSSGAKSSNSDPITIINNGIHDEKSASFIPYSEHPDKDKSSIYLTSTQKLPINFIKMPFEASSNPPILPSNYNKPQILINSDRIVLSAKRDAVMLQAAESINLSSKSIGINGTNEFVVSSNNIRLGSNVASESLMLGNKTNRLLVKALTSLNDLVIALQDLQNYPGGQPVPNQDVILQAVNTENRINEVIDSLKDKMNLSQTSKTA